MLKQISRTVVQNKSYEDLFQAVWESDKDITTDEAEKLMKDRYFYFPCTKSTYKLDGNKMIIDYTIDRCN